MSNPQTKPQTASNDAPKPPAPGVASPPPQQSQGDKPVTKTADQQK
jgi:hypothetical protein